MKNIPGRSILCSNIFESDLEMRTLLKEILLITPPSKLVSKKDFKI